MAKFTKTTEIDISAMHEVVEEVTPNKSKLGLVLSIVVSIVIAFVIWVAATEISTDTHIKVIEDVPVIGSTETIDIEVEGTYSALADLKKQHIEVYPGADSYSVVITKNSAAIKVISPSKK